MGALKENYVIQKLNVLNELRANSMSLQELRFFSIYLSKINKDDVRTRVVRFSISDFRSIMDLGRIDIRYMKTVINDLLGKVMYVPLENGGYTGFQLFKECTVSQDKDGLWYVEIDAHDKALPLMFDYRNKYLTYELWNTLRLKSSNQFRMYEILKQFQKIGYRILSIKRLKELLGVGTDEYTRYRDFTHRVLDACQQALKENTDIQFEYEPYLRDRGRGRRVLSLKFTIKENKNHKDALSLDRFIDLQKVTPITVADESDESDESDEDPNMEFFMDAFDREFAPEEVRVLLDRLRQHNPGIMRDSMQVFHYFYDRYNEMKRMEKRTKIKDPFSYVKSLMGKDL